MTKRKITTIGGGTGQFALLSALRKLPNTDITAVVSMADSGGSTGRLRDELGALPPGDVLKALLALSSISETLARDLLLKRFTSGVLAGHNAGNMLLTILAQYSGSFTDAVRALGELLETTGAVLPVTVGSITLRARLADGTIIVGETNIDRPNGRAFSKIDEVWLEPNALALPGVLRAIRDADYLMIGPGDLYTSLLPVLLVHGVRDAVIQSRGEMIYIGNTMTKAGETNDFTLRNFVYEVERYASRKIDRVIAAQNDIPDDVKKRYADEDSILVSIDMTDGDDGRKLIAADLVKAGAFVRHDPLKLAKILRTIIV